MTPRDITDHLLSLMMAFTESHSSPPPLLQPMQIMFNGGANLIDPSSVPALAALGTATVTPWIEALAKIGYVGSVGPIPSGWLVFAPSQSFYTMRDGSTPERLRLAVLSALFKEQVITPGQGSIQVAELRDEIREFDTQLDKELIDVLLYELHSVAERDCRHASIALCGKLLELALGSLLVRWGGNFSETDALGELICKVQGRAREQQPNEIIRREAQNMLALGIPGLADLIRTVRNGAIHARHSINGSRVALPSKEQSEAVILLTVDLFRRFVMAPPIGV